jgi:hypothetical protein
MAFELTAVSAVQAYLGDASITSAVLTPIINAAEAVIARRCNRYDETQQGSHWLTAARIQYIDGEWSDYVQLKFTPVTGITEIAVIYGPSSTQVQTLTNFTCDGREISGLGATTPASKGKLVMRFSNVAYAWSVGLPYYDYAVDLGIYGVWSAFSGGYQRVRVTYTGGFASAPADLARAATMLSAEMYRSQTRNMSVKSETLGDYSVTYLEQIGQQVFTLSNIDGIIANHFRPVF